MIRTRKRLHINTKDIECLKICWSQSIGLPILLTLSDLSRHTHTNSATVSAHQQNYMNEMDSVHKNIEQHEVYVLTNGLTNEKQINYIHNVHQIKIKTRIPYFGLQAQL